MIDINELRRLAQAALAAPDGLSAEWMDRLGQFQEAADASVVSELLDRLEAAENDAAHQKALADSALRVAEGWERKCDALRAKVEQMERQEPVAWKYEIAAYADHRTDVGVVLNKRELSSAVPAEQITWTPLFAFDGRQTPEASMTAVEMIDRIEAAEKERDNANAAAVNIALEAERLQCENDALRAAVRHEADCVEACKSEIEALRAKIARMEQQEPVFWWRPCSDGAYEGPLHNNSIERVRKQSGAWSPLYALPGAQGEEK